MNVTGKYVCNLCGTEHDGPIVEFDFMAPDHALDVLRQLLDHEGEPCGAILTDEETGETYVCPTEPEWEAGLRLDGFDHDGGADYAAYLRALLDAHRHREYYGG